MSRAQLADAFDKAAEALGQLAHELRANDSPGQVPSAPASRGAGAVPPSAPAPLPPKRTAPDTSGITECPAHRQPFKDGNFGKFCTGKAPEGETEDPNWYNDKGYCRVTPKSAGAWLKQHPSQTAAPAAAPAQDVDDIPF